MDLKSLYKYALKFFKLAIFFKTSFSNIILHKKFDKFKVFCKQ